LREHLCFHAQQAVEKALKAVLLTFHTPLPRTHDVGHLLTLLPPTLPQPAAVRQAGVLTKYAVQAAILPIGMKSLRAIMRRP